MRKQSLLDKKQNAFTIVELVVAIFISVILLWGIFYFLSDTILGIARSSSQAKFLKDFYSFSSVLDTGKMEILHDNVQGTFDVALIKSIDNTSGVLLGVIDKSSSKLVPISQAGKYLETYLAYRPLTQAEISNIATNSGVVYNYDFFSDKVFYNFHVADMQLQEYGSGANTHMDLKIFTEFRKSLEWSELREVPQDDFHNYSIVF